MSALNTLVGGLITTIKDKIDPKTANSVAIILAISGGGAILATALLPIIISYNKSKIELGRIKHGQ